MPATDMAAAAAARRCPHCGKWYMTTTMRDAHVRNRHVSERLEYLRGEIEAERISYGEIAELQSLAAHIDPADVVLLQWAGVPEYPDTAED